MNAADDKVVLKGIKFETVVGLDAWHRPNKAQPIELELHLGRLGGLEAAARDDAVAHTIDYGKAYKALKAGVFDQKFESVVQLYQGIRTSLPDLQSWSIVVSLPKGVLGADGGVSFSWTGESEGPVIQVLTVHDLYCRCIIGVNEHERLEKQRLLISIKIWGMENRLSPNMFAGVDMSPSDSLSYQNMIKEVIERVEASSYETIEALATAIAQVATMGHGFEKCSHHD